MAYRIEYDGSAKKYEKPRSSHLARYTAAFLLLFVFWVNMFWPEGKATLWKIIWPGDMEITRAALVELRWDLESGENMGEALEGFCREIIDSSQYGGY